MNPYSVSRVLGKHSIDLRFHKTSESRAKPGNVHIFHILHHVHDPK